MATIRTYAVGSAGSVFRLDAHTAPWIDVTPGPSIEWDAYDVMTDPNDSDKVIIVGDYIGLPRTGILVSTDAGVTWNEPTGDWTNVITTYKEVWYVDSNIIWVVGWDGTVLKSLDGGLSFNLTTRINPALDLRTTAIHALDLNTAVVAGGPVDGSTAVTTYVWKTIDGGVTWNLLNGGTGLNTLGTIGNADGIIISADEQRITVGTGQTQQLSIDGGLTFTASPTIPRAGYHLTWYPSYDPNPATIRHVGGSANNILESLDNGTTWNVTVLGLPGIIRGAHFYSVNDGYLIAGASVFSTDDGGVTPVLSFSSIVKSLQAVWTGTPVAAPCYLITDCEDDQNTMTVTLPIGSTLDLNSIYNFEFDPAKCWTIEESDACDEGSPEVTPVNSWIDCAECLNPLIPNTCWDLEVVCDGPCPDISAINTFDFTPYIGQNISIQPPLTTEDCWYTPYALRQAIFETSVQTSPTLAWSFGPFQQGTADITVGLTSFIYNNVEQIVGSPPTYLLTPGNIQFVNCDQQLVCVPTVLTNNDETGYSNTVDFINVQLALLGLHTIQAANMPLDACSNPEDKPREYFRMQYRDGDTFTMVLSFSSGTNIINFELKVAAGNVTTNINLTSTNEKDACNDVVYCNTPVGTYPVINTVAIQAECEPLPLGEACELTPRLGEPGFSVKNCDPKQVVDVKTKFANSVYALFKRMRYGIETCCEYDLDKIDIKNQLIDLGSIYDPNLCIEEEVIDDCCPQPCNAVAVLTVPEFTSCPAPTDPIVAIIAINPLSCQQLDFTAPIGTGGGSVSGILCDGSPFTVDLPADTTTGPTCVQTGSVTTTGNITVTTLGNCT